MLLEEKMKSINVGTSILDLNDFLVAVRDELTCTDCYHCQVNLKKKDRSAGYYCYHSDSIQTTLYGVQPITVNKDFLCIRFIASDEIRDEFFERDNQDFVKWCKR
jgi:hypothetical protein